MKCFGNEYFGVCPSCGEPNEFLDQLNLWQSNYFCCHKHRLYWRVGTNLLGSQTIAEAGFRGDNAVKAAIVAELAVNAQPRLPWNRSTGCVTHRPT